MIHLRPSTARRTTFERGSNESPAPQVNGASGDSGLSANDTGAARGAADSSHDSDRDQRGAHSDFNSPSYPQDQMDDGVTTKIDAIKRRLHAHSRD